jgi:23S rRNA (pseudouridine1915-N3)-methyltransferase
LVDRYLKRLRPTPRLIEIADGTGSPVEIKRREATSLLAALPARSFVVALDLAGAAPDTDALVRLLAQWREAGRALAFVIGGAEGLDASVLARADATLSLGRLTWPHMLVRVMLVEQLYRAQAIASGHPYHRSGRP